jgi:vacuolar protein sorting-associated protein 41
VYTNDVDRLKCQQHRSTTQITTVTLDPRHSHRKTKEFVYGTDTGMLLLSSKGWLGNTETILFQGRGRVYTARMSGTLLAWATESGLRVYNTADHSRIGKIDRPTSSLPPSGNSNGASGRSTPTSDRSTNINNKKFETIDRSGGSDRCSLTWIGDRELLVGWGRHVMVLAVVPVKNTSSTTAVPLPPGTPSSSSSTAAPPPPPPPQQSMNGGEVTPRQQLTSPVPRSSATASGTASSSSSRQFTLEVVSKFEIHEDAENNKDADTVVVGVAPFGRHLAVLMNTSIESSTCTVFKVFDRSGNGLFTDQIETAKNNLGAPSPLTFKSFYSLSDVLKETLTTTGTTTAAALSPPNSTNTSPSAPSADYKWWSEGAEPVYFIISSNSITLGRPRSATDRISWLIERNRYEEAVQIAESDPTIDADKKVQLGEQYLHYLIGTEERLALTATTPRNSITTGAAENQRIHADGDRNNIKTMDSSAPISIETEFISRKNTNQIKNELINIENYKKAADVCPHLLGKDPAAWERWVYIFGQAAMLPLLAPNVPTSDPVLSRDAYDMVLTACLRGSSTSSSVARRTTTPPVVSTGSSDDGAIDSTITNSTIIMPAAHDVFRDLVERWPHGIYDARALLNQLQPRLEQRPSSGSTSRKNSITPPSSSSSSAALKRAAASLYAQVGEHDAALQLLLELRSPCIFEYIKTNALQFIAANYAAELIELDEVKATHLFVEAVEEAPPATVVASLQSKISASGDGGEGDIATNTIWSLRLYHYLDWLWQKEISPTGSGPSSISTATTFSSSFSELHIELCAIHNPDKLMHILSTSSSYPLDTALHVCESRGMVRESVYLLGRMGSSKSALRLIITQLRDVEGAVTFVQDSRDDELWELLISLTLGDAALTGELLDHAGSSCVDPLRFIEKIPENIKIERLRDRLVRVITDFRATVSLQSGCNAVLRADCLELGDKLYLELRRALKTLFVLKPGGRWSRSTNAGGGEIVDRNSNGGVVGGSIEQQGDREEEGFPFGKLQLQQQSDDRHHQQRRVWIGCTSSTTSGSAGIAKNSSRKMSLTPPPSVHTSPSKFPPRKNKDKLKQQQQRTVVV